MKRNIGLLLLCTLAFACDDPPPQMVGSFTYDACTTTQRGNCSDNCCAESVDTTFSSLTHNLYVACDIRRGSQEESYRLNFQIQESSRFSIEGIDMEFDPDWDQPHPVRQCGGLVITYEGNTYDSEDCGLLDVRSDELGGGGCEVMVYLDDAGTIRGSFRCKELKIPSIELYLSTLHGSEVGWGEFQVEHCSQFL